MAKNKYGLSRDIPSQVKRKLRQDCGYGCVCCGSAIYEYEHIDPPFPEARAHNPNSMALLCGTCHGMVTRGIWSKDKIAEARLDPRCKQQGFSHFNFDITKENQFTVGIGNYEFVRPLSIIEIDDVNILTVSPPEFVNTPPRISARFYDRNNQEIVSIQDNEWKGASDAFDIEVSGPTFKVRSALRNIDLQLTLQPPNKIVIDKLNLQYNGKKIVGDTSNGFVFESEDSSLRIPNDGERIIEAPFWISISDRIRYGRDKAYYYKHQSEKRFQSFPGSMEVVNNTDVEFVDPASVGLELPETGMGLDPNRKIMKITVREGFGGIEMPMSPPNKETKSTKKKSDPFGKKVGRNKPCPCGSGIKYKYCHGK